MSRVVEGLTNEYFDWLCDHVSRRGYCGRTSYLKVLSYLHNIDFTYTIEMDGNRADDGIDLRYRFAREKRYDHRIIASCLDVYPCSVLEMMIALAIRGEDIMYDPEFGDRTAHWFWVMMTNLGLDIMDDEHFNERRVKNNIDIFLSRTYTRYGEGALFTIPDCKHDLRRADIWYQMNWYFNTI